MLKTRIEAPARRIVWQCPVCGLSGSIVGWEGTRWNRRSAPRGNWGAMIEDGHARQLLERLAELRFQGR